MKNIALLTCFIAANLFLQAQLPVNDSVSLSAGYTKMSFYSLANGETANVNAKDWDLQFWTSLMEASIRINDGANVSLYQLANDDTLAWSSVDTTGMTALHNSDSLWGGGAFNILAAGTFDYGWGDYDQISHNVIGKRIFVMKTLNGNYKKIWVKQLVFGDAFEIEIGNLDHTGDTIITLSKSDYPGKEFFYYAIDSAEAKDIEPVDTTWDLVFRRYQSFVSFPPPAQFYTVAGALSHPAVSVAEARAVDVNSNDTTGLVYESDISVIGSDWKNFNQTTFQYEIVDSLDYFVRAQDGNIYKVVFTGFGGSATGKVFFSKTLIPQQSTGIHSTSAIQTLDAYPNPAEEKMNVLFSLKSNSAVTIKILDVAGKCQLNTKMSAQEGLNNIALNTSVLQQGFYFLSVNDGNNQLAYKFVKN